MKKKLLLVAFTLFTLFGLASQANAVNPVLTQKWSIKSGLPTETNARQATLINGKFYIQNRVDKQIEIWTEAGKSETTIPSGAGAAITSDDAGNIITSLIAVGSTFPGKWSKDLKIIPADGSTPIDIDINFDFDGFTGGRADYFGHVKGNVMDETTGGVLYICFSTKNTIISIPIKGGAQDLNNTTKLSSSITFDATSLAYPYGDDLIVHKRDEASITKANISQDPILEETLTTPGKNTFGGSSVFSLDGRDFIIYNVMGGAALTYVDGFAIADLATGEVVAQHDAENTNRSISAVAQWIFAEKISETEAIIYQYHPGGMIAAYSFAVPPIYLIGQTEDNGNEWNPTKGTTLSYAGNDTYSGRIFFGSKDIPTPVFAISTVLAENNDGGGWSYVNSNRYGASSSNPTLNPFNATTITKDPNYGFTIASGTYDVTVDMTAKTINCVPVLYIMGTTDITNYTWAPDNGAEFTYNGSGTYTLRDVLITRAEGHKIRGNFAITNCLNADWDITNAYRYGPITDLSIIDQNLTDLTKANTSYQAKGGTYNINIDMNTKKISITSLDDPDAIPGKLYIIGNIDGVTPKADATDYFNPSSYTKYLELNASGNYDGYASGIDNCLFSLSTDVSISENDWTGFNEGRLGAETDQLLLSVGDTGFPLTPKGTNSFKLPTTNKTRITVSPSKNLISIGHTTGTETIDTETGVKVIAGYGEINVIGNVSTIEVYSANGTLISKGEQNVKCQAGLYIVKFDNKVTKVIVK